jgi:hypothetical protein
MTRPWSTVQVKQWSEHDSKKPGTKPEMMKNSEDLVRKLPNVARQGASSNPKRNWQQGPTCGRGKALEDSGSNTRQSKPLARPKWAQASRPSPFQGPVDPPFNLAAIQTIYSPEARSHASTHSSSATEELRREGHHLRGNRARKTTSEFVELEARSR